MSQHDLRFESDHPRSVSSIDEMPTPSLIRTMATVRWLILGGMSLFALIMVLGFFGLAPWAGNDGGAQQYHCPMHPTYISDQPGDCPICGMSLVPIEKDEKSAPAETVSGPGQPQAISTARPGQYACPMHPEIVSDSLSRCPECGMWLEKVAETGAEHTGHDMDDDQMAAPSPSVPGLIEVTIEPQRQQLIGVRTGRAQRRRVGENLRLVGYITADETRVANLHVRVNGWVQQLFVNQTGQAVSAGQPLMTLYSPELYQAQQDFRLALQNGGGGTNDSALASLHSEIVDAARERLVLLGMSADEIPVLETGGQIEPNLMLRSPFGGVVLGKAVFEGQYVGPDQNLFVVADLSTVWVLADAYESEFQMIPRGQPVSVSTASLPGKSFRGAIDFIYPTVDEKTRTSKVRIVLANKSFALQPGMYVDVKVESSGKESLVVPYDAVLDGGESQYVFVVHDGVHFEPRMVTTGRRSDDWIEILGGLDEGQDVVTSANFLVDSESRLKAAITGMGAAQTGGHQGHSQ